LFIESYYGGSHRQLLNTIIDGINYERVNGYQLLTLPDKKWHWRARTSALYFAETIPHDHSFKILFASSVLNLAELIGLRPDLNQLKKVLYFHENQLIYPVRKQQERDFQYGYNQIISCLSADEILFNSSFNMNSFLNSIQTFFKLQPDYRPKDLSKKIEPKCRVLYFPVQKPLKVSSQPADQTLHIVWPHRWEHDKGPEAFFRIINVLLERQCKFDLSVLGEQYSEVPPIFEESKTRLEASELCTILNWGFVSRTKFIETLSSAHVVVSTAIHEFFGVSMIEAAMLGCYPLCPNKLSYPEIFPKSCLYNTENQLIKKLQGFCRNPAATRKISLDLDRYSWDHLKADYTNILLY